MRPDREPGPRGVRETDRYRPEKVFPVMNQMIQDFVSQAPFVVLAASSAEGNCKVGLLFLIPRCDWTVRLNGRVSVLESDEGQIRGVSPEVFAPDDKIKGG